MQTHNPIEPVLELYQLFSVDHFRRSVSQIISSMWESEQKEIEEYSDREVHIDDEMGDPLVEPPQYSVPTEYVARMQFLNMCRVVQTRLRRSIKLKNVIQSKIIDKLSHPRIIAADDIVDLIASLLGSDSSGTSTPLWDAAANELINRTCECAANQSSDDSQEMEVAATLPFLAPAQPNQHLFHLGNRIWVTMRSSDDYGGSYRISMSLTGHCSQSAAYDISRLYLRPFAVLLEVCAKRGSWLGTDRTSGMFFELLKNGKTYNSRGAEDIRDESEQIRQEEQIRSVLFAISAFRLFIGYGGSRAAFESARMLNALRIMAEVKHQREPTISIALAFTAIESLLGTEKESVSEQIARRTAVLLCPNPDDRRQAAEQVKKLYGYRSKVLHGASVKIDASEASEAIELAEIIILAILEWERAERRMSESIQEKDGMFFQRLKDADYSGKMLVCIPDDIARRALDILRISSL